MVKLSERLRADSKDYLFEQAAFSDSMRMGMKVMAKGKNVAFSTRYLDYNHQLNQLIMHHLRLLLCQVIGQDKKIPRFRLFGRMLR